MGLSKSKHKPRKGEEQKGRVYSVPKARERPTGRHSQESEKPPDAKPAESLHGKRGAAKRQWASSEVEGLSHEPASSSDSPRWMVEACLPFPSLKEGVEYSPPSWLSCQCMKAL
ncbi:spermatogenesis-associated protein 33 isoform X2 [Panthera uncia]|uniref:spermatogenesis-associated protein 33 isoform X2 n=1 Tax=Panthera uncia TaxID=29064 RepID=UPI0020FFDF19|nr:spermatogenesis-associated protein 33 isoform X2 [Panthera uncia]